MYLASSQRVGSGFWVLGSGQTAGHLGAKEGNFFKKKEIGQTCIRQ